MKVVLLGLLAVISSVGMADSSISASEFVVYPYVQNPAQNAMTVIWITRSAKPGTLQVKPSAGSQARTFTSKPKLTKAIAYHQAEVSSLPGGKNPGTPYLHRIRIEQLKPGTRYTYTVKQGSEKYSREFRTTPSADSSIRFIVYADSETEPESTNKPAKWPVPFGAKDRKYVVDQTEGYRQNLKIMKSAKPDFIAIAGDIVQSGDEQRDWDEFWRHNAGKLSANGEMNDIASSTPIFPAVGNHENYGGPGNFGGYSTSAARHAVGRYQAYFETPDNGSNNPHYEDRYYRVDFGPITYITVDSSDGKPHATPQDTNYLLAGKQGGGTAPDFNPGSKQYKWLEKQLADAQKKSKFTFVQFHHSPYSIGPHGFPAGTGKGRDTQSGQPMRVLSPLFEQYGVDAVFCGHDEIYEHSIVNGIHYYDIGIGGDGLRGPMSGKDGSTGLPSPNRYQKFLAHLNSLERWDGKRLLSGGKHYGHLVVDIYLDKQSHSWKAKLTPTYSFPNMDRTTGKVLGWERRTYNDQVILSQ